MWYLEAAETQMEFAGVSTKYKSNNVKLAISISNWPFYMLSNTLVISLDSVYTQSSDSSNECVNKQENEDENLRWFLATIDSVSLYLKF